MGETELCENQELKGERIIGQIEYYGRDVGKTMDYG